MGPGQVDPRQMCPGRLGLEQMGPSLRTRFLNSYVHCALDCTLVFLAKAQISIIC